MARSPVSMRRRFERSAFSVWLVVGAVMLGLAVSVVLLPAKINLGIVAALTLALVVLVRADIGVAALIFLYAFPELLDYNIVQVRALNLFNIVFLVTFLSAFHQKFIREHERFPKTSPIHVPMLLYLAMMFVGILRSPEEGFGQRVVYNYFKQLEYFIAFYMIFYLLKEENARWLVRSLVIGMALIGVFAIRQHAIDVATHSETAQHHIRTVIQGFNASGLGIFMAQSGFLPLILAFNEKDPVKKIPYLLIFGVCMGALFISFSRAAYAAFAAVSLLASFFIKGNRLILLGMIAAAILFAPGAVKQRVFMTVTQTSNDEFEMDSSAENHLEVYENAYKLIQENPLVLIVGGGVGYYEANYEGGNTHSSYLHILLSYGLIGMFVWTWMTFAILGVCLRQFKEERDSYFRSLSLAGILGVVAMMICGGFHDNNAGNNLFYILLLTGVVAWRGQIVQNTEKNKALSRRLN